MFLNRLSGKKGSQNHKKTSIGKNLVVFKKKDFREDYVDVKRVGVGSISNIYIVRPKNTEKSTSKDKVILYALKEIDKAFLDEHCMDEMKNEIALMRNITHPNILKIYEVYENKHISIVMELCTGGDLNKRVPYSEMQAKLIVTKLVEATNYLHKSNIIHRDLKFENIMFESTEKDAEIKVIDFGLSTKFKKGERIMETLGTIYTMSPEVLRGDYDKQADMWSIGVVTFQLLANEKPFWGDSVEQIANLVIAGKFTFDVPAWEKISSQAKDFIKKLLVMDPKARLTAQKALNHPWIADLTHMSGISSSSAKELMRSLSSFEKSSELKKLALQAIAHKTTTDEIMQMRELFHAIDVDHDGRITLKEFKNARRGTCSEKEIEQLFKSIDVNESGSIDYTEFLAATLEAQGEIREQHIKEAFDVFDLDQSGFISPEEIRKVSGNEADSDYIDRLVKEADTNKDGKISFAEFQAAVQKTTQEMVDEVKDNKKFPMKSWNEKKVKKQSPTFPKSDNVDPDEFAA